jgi:thiosulfate/3-mercaptopyruvate sulfurtransferase
MNFTTLVDTATLATHLHDPDWIILDCRFSLDNPELGRRQHLAEHIPGALYVHLEEDLSGPISSGVTGRHPLPDPAGFSWKMTQLGLTGPTQVIAYDDSAGAIAARLWWMLKWTGHESVAVLDGGWSKWRAEDRPTRPGQETSRSGDFVASIQPGMAVETEGVKAVVEGGPGILWDARAAERYRGEVEPIDPVAGHIPGAHCVPYAENLRADGTFQPSALLRQRFLRLLGTESSSDVICYCGSGVTAAHNILALEVAGLQRPKLYAGSWSQWITDGLNPISTGPEPPDEGSNR